MNLHSPFMPLCCYDAPVHPWCLFCCWFGAPVVRRSWTRFRCFDNLAPDAEAAAADPPPFPPLTPLCCPGAPAADLPVGCRSWTRFPVFDDLARMLNTSLLLALPPCAPVPPCVPCPWCADPWTRFRCRQPGPDAEAAAAPQPLDHHPGPVRRHASQVLEAERGPDAPLLPAPARGYSVPGRYSTASWGPFLFILFQVRRSQHSTFLVPLTVSLFRYDSL